MRSVRYHNPRSQTLHEGQRSAETEEAADNLERDPSGVQYLGHVPGITSTVHGYHVTWCGRVLPVWLPGDGCLGGVLETTLWVEQDHRVGGHPVHSV